jgi:hypothetical protein
MFTKGKENIAKYERIRKHGKRLVRAEIKIGKLGMEVGGKTCYPTLLHAGCTA